MSSKKDIALHALVRDLAKTKASHLRNEQKIPAILYGHEVENVALTLDAKSFRKIYQDAGSNTLVTLTRDNADPVKILIHDVQFDPAKDEILHADLYAVNLKETVDTEIPLRFVGTAPAVRELEGNLITSLTEFEVRALPTDLVDAIEVDIAVLKTFDDMIHVSDIQVPVGIEILNDADAVVASVEEPMSEEELQAELAQDTTAVEAEAVEKLDKEKEKEVEQPEAKEADTKEEKQEN
ncbi:50S ribosomal protein L25 [Candidatus Berkelbacteria bacterium]|nr:50S ribosomal protein L25 [Candidatus Berkelbacteria bacterium]